MPELCEVEAARLVVDENCVGKKITSCRVWDDDIVFTSPSTEFQSHLTGNKIVSTHRHGKNIFFKLAKKPWPSIHFGMTGSFEVEGVDYAKYYREKAGDKPVWPPKFVKFEIVFADGTKLAYRNSRRLGRVRLHQDIMAELPFSKLGRDPYIDMPSEDEFIEIIQNRKSPIKAVLLNQAVLAGIGNWIADEVLYQSGILPERRSNLLNKPQCRTIRNCLQYILKIGCETRANYKLFPKNWLFHYRWTGKKASNDFEGHPLSFSTVGGRTSAVVRKIQKLSKCRDFDQMPAQKPGEYHLKNSEHEKKKKASKAKGTAKRKKKATAKKTATVKKPKAKRRRA